MGNVKKDAADISLVKKWPNTEEQREKYRACKRAWYKVHKERLNRAIQGKINARREWLNTLKRKPCQDCGIIYPPMCMDFDHREGTIKSFSVGGRILNNTEVVLAEIAKCDLVCANCHRIRTWARNHYCKRT